VRSKQQVSRAGRHQRLGARGPFVKGTGDFWAGRGVLVRIRLAQVYDGQGGGWQGGAVWNG